jgi:hypothetical protein
MKRIVRVALVCGCFALAMYSLALLAAEPNAAVTYTVFRVQTDATGDRYRTIEAALRAAVIFRQTHATAPIRIEISPGDYYLDTTLKIGTELSGDAQNPTEILAASAGQPPHLIAGRKLDLHWLPFRDGIVQAKLDHGMSFDQLYVDGHAQVRARYPNIGAGGALAATGVDVLAPARVARWKNPAGAILQALHEKRWGGMQVPILGKQPDGTLNFGPAVGNNRPSPAHATYRYVENVFEELDAPREWFFDADSATLYWMPPVGTDLSAAKIEINGPARIFDLQGSETTPLRHLRIAGLNVAHSGTSFLRDTEPLLRSDWMIAREGAIYLERTEDVQIEGNEFSELGGNAVFVSGYNRRAKIAHNHIHDIAGGGIDFVGRPDAVRSPSFRYEDFVALEKMDRIAGPKSDNYPGDSSAEDNLIHAIGSIEKQVAGVEISMAKNIRVAHNSIYDVPRAGINIGDGAWGGHVIEFNDVFDTVLETGDHGAFNAWGRDRYWHPDRKVMDQINAKNPDLWKLDVVAPITLRNNRFRCDHGWDIDLDDGASNYRIYDNLLLAGGLKFREGFDREATNNILVNNSFHPHVWFAGSGDKFERNIVMSGYQPILTEHWDAVIDRNLFPTQSALQHAQKLGLDAHSRFGDPGFIDALHGNFQVSSASPALALGFRNFPMDTFGVTGARLKALAKTAPIPELVSAAQAQLDKKYTFLGASIKSVSSLGEQSAAGLAQIKGILVLDVPKDSLAARSGLAANDVIIESPADSMGAELERIDTVQDLLRLSSARAWRGELVVVVMRNQQRATLTLKTAQQ